MIEAGWTIRVISQANFGRYYPFSKEDYWNPLLSVSNSIPGINEKGIMARLVGARLANKMRTISWVVKALCAGLAALRKQKYDFVLSRAAPQYGHLPALIVSRVARIPWIANWSDPMPPQKAPPPYGGGPSANAPGLSNVYCRTIVRMADWHTFPCERLRRYFSRIYPELEGKSSVIPHIALEQFCIKPGDRGKDFSLCHTGSIALRDPSAFFEGLKLFREAVNPSESLRIAFIGHPDRELQMKVQEAGLADIVCIESSKTYEETQLKAAASSVLVVIEAPCEEGIFLPSKFVDFIQTGRPILAISPQPGTLNDLISAHGGGIAVDCSSPAMIAGALATLYSEWRDGDIDEKYGSKRLFDLFSEHHVLKCFSRLFDDLSPDLT